MTSHAALRVLEIRPRAEHDAVVACLLELACGCIVERKVARDRLVELGGAVRAVGKYACPVGHAVGGTRG